MAKVPLTGRFGSSNAGGDWGVNLRWAGYNQLVIRGKASRTVVLYIENGDFSFGEAAHLWGEDTWYTTELLWWKT